MAYDRTLLTPEALQQFLAEHPGGSTREGCCAAPMRRPRFLTGIAFVSRVAKAAEAADHHPDIDIRWRKVTLALVTHDAGGLTWRDTKLAAEADRCSRRW